jgi:hypothetical protein
MQIERANEGNDVSEERPRVRPEPLSEEAWAPFGWLPVADTDPRDGDHRMTFVWDDVHVNLIGHARSEVPATADGLRCEMLRLEPLEPLVLHRGTWHWGPFPVAEAEVRLFNVQGLRYAEDNTCMDLAARGLDVDVQLV